MKRPLVVRETTGLKHQTMTVASFALAFFVFSFGPCHAKAGVCYFFLRVSVFAKKEIMLRRVREEGSPNIQPG
jgi:hypothetical protein